MQKVQTAKQGDRWRRLLVSKTVIFSKSQFQSKRRRFQSQRHFQISKVRFKPHPIFYKFGQVKKSLEESGARVSAAEDDFYATMNAFMVELEKYTELIQITPIRNGRTLRTMLEQSTFYWVVEEFGDHIPAAREAFAKLENYLDNYLEIGRAKIEALCTRGKLDDYLKDPEILLMNIPQQSEYALMPI